MQHWLAGLTQRISGYVLAIYLFYNLITYYRLFVAWNGMILNVAFSLNFCGRKQAIKIMHQDIHHFTFKDNSIF